MFMYTNITNHLCSWIHVDHNSFACKTMYNISNQGWFKSVCKVQWNWTTKVRLSINCFRDGHTLSCIQYSPYKAPDTRNHNSSLNYWSLLKECALRSSFVDINEFRILIESYIKNPPYQQIMQHSLLVSNLTQLFSAVHTCFLIEWNCIIQLKR